MSDTAVRFVDVKNITRWAAQEGVENIMLGMIDYIEADFRRWPVFDKCARIGSHSDVGVIELMPTSDGQEYGFKYVNGHPSNPPAVIRPSRHSACSLMLPPVTRPSGQR